MEEREFLRPKAFARPERLDQPLETLPGVGPGARAEAAAARPRRACATCCSGGRAGTSPRPARWRSPSSGATEEVAISGVVESVRLRRIAGRLVDRDRARVGLDRDDLGELVQPAVARGQARCPARAVRLRGRLSRYGFEVRSYDVARRGRPRTSRRCTARARRCPSTRLRELVRAALDAARLRRARRAAGASEALPIRRDALAAIHFPEDPDAGRGRAAAARVRRARGAAAGGAADAGRGRAGRPLPPPGRARRALSGRCCRSS